MMSVSTKKLMKMIVRNVEIYLIKILFFKKDPLFDNDR